MRRKKFQPGLLCALTLGFIAGCADYRINDEHYLNPAHLSPEALADVPDHRLCEAYSLNRAPRLRAELKRRGTFTELEWQAIDGRKVLMGMSEMALMTALPGMTRTRTLRSNGVITKEWYDARYSAIEVRTENGKVVWFR
jgi:hypothetical protein